MATATKQKAQKVTMQVTVTVPGNLKPTQIVNAINTIINTGVDRAIGLPDGFRAASGFKITKAKIIQGNESGANVNPISSNRPGTTTGSRSNSNSSI